MTTHKHTCSLTCLAAVALAYPWVSYGQDTCYLDNAGRIVHRWRPGFKEVPCPAPTSKSGQPPQSISSPQGDVQRPLSQQAPDRAPPARVSPLPRPRLADYVAAVPVPDRWRIVDDLGYHDHFWDPYNRNVLKADKPVHGDWFFNLGLISDSVYEHRELVTPVGGATSRSSGSNDVFGRDSQWVYSQNIATELVYYKGDTTFKPPDYEFRFTPVFNYNYASVGEVSGVNADPRAGTSRSDHHVGIQAAFADMRLRDVSANFDFDSVRVGIQPFSSDFRGFLFQDNQLGVRLFGTRDNNRYQYNLAYFRRLEKDTNSGLNAVGEPLRHDDIIVANLYRQDLPVKGFTSQAIVLYNRNRERGEMHYDENGFLVRPAPLGIEESRNYDVTYLGYNGDGHFGRLNLTTSLYYALGKESPGTFVPRDVDVRAWFTAFEVSADVNWLRPRLSFAYGSGDKNPLDGRDTGFDAVLENPQFAGADASYWIRQAVPLVGGGGVTLSGRNGLLNSLRSSKDEGQSNFANPGIMLSGVGADADLLPTLRLSFNANELWFANTAVVEFARNQGGVPRNIGADLSASVIWRPLLSQNIVVRTSYARLIAGKGFEALFPHRNPDYFLFNLLLAY